MIRRFYIKFESMNIWSCSFYYIWVFIPILWFCIELWFCSEICECLIHLITDIIFIVFKLSSIHRGIYRLSSFIWKEFLFSFWKKVLKVSICFVKHFAFFIIIFIHPTHIWWLYLRANSLFTIKQNVLLTFTHP